MPGPRLIADPDVIRTGTGAPLVLAHGAGGSVGLNFGQVIAQGAPAAVQADPEVNRAYLGGGDVGALRRRLRAQPA